MKRVDVEFVRRAPPGRALWLVPMLLAGTSVALAAWGWTLHVDADGLRQEAREWQAQVDAKLASSSRRAVVPAAPAPAYAADAQAALRLQRVPVNAVLASLESVGTVGVLPVSVDISSAEATVRVQVEFSTYEALLKYLEDLNAGEPAERWILATAQGSAQGGSGRPTALIVSRWRGRE